MSIYHFSEGALDLPDDYARSSVHSFVREVEGRTVTIVLTSTPEQGDAMAQLQQVHNERSRHIRRLRVVTPPTPMREPQGAAKTSWEFLHERLGMTRITEILIPLAGCMLGLVATCEAQIGDSHEAELAKVIRTLRLRRSTS